jgi:hypothetical protein
VVTSSTASNEEAAVAELVSQLTERAGGAIRGGILYNTVGYDGTRLSQALRRRLPDLPFLGATSCQSVATDGRPAAEVYNEWVVGPCGPCSSRAATSSCRPTCSFVLVHPERVNVPSRSLSLFATVKEGEEVVPRVRWCAGERTWPGWR